MASDTSILAIVARFSGFSNPVMEEVLKEFPFEFCGILTVGAQQQLFKTIPEERQEWFVSSRVRGCEYAGVDFETLEPLDEELILQMRDSEAVFMELVTRLEEKRSIPYRTRKRWYLRHLRFWNDYLTRHKINLFLSAWVPHEIPDMIIYDLCKLRGIPVIYFGVTSIRDTSFLERDWKESAVQIYHKLEELIAHYRPGHDPMSIPLEERLDLRYRGLMHPEGERPTLEEQELDFSYKTAIKRLAARKPLTFLKHGLKYFTFRGAARALESARRSTILAQANAYYDRHAVEPDLSRSFVYMPLNMQPEATTVPLAGGYGDLVLTAELLHATLPEGTLIYVKEHPRPSSAQKRNVDFYKDFAAIPSVRFVPRSYDTFVLRENCKAIATAAGTAGFEGPFRGKPVILFGHNFYQHARGVYLIHSIDDCRRAVHEIFVERKTPTLLESRLFMKAIELTCVHGVLDPWCFNVTHLTQEENSRNCSRAIIEELRRLFPHFSSR